MNGSKDVPLLVALTSCADYSPRLVGTKALNLGRLANAGFPVPAGAVLTTTAFSAWLASNGERIEAALQSSIPASVREAVREALGLLGEGPLAVRSSSPAEDLKKASFAGQYETTLGARGEASVMAAVLRSWRSVLAGPAKTYAGSESREPATMAVLIQQLVPAEAAGVAFTADPVTGDRNITLVSAVKGLGERLVSGSATPEEWVVQNGTPVRRSGAELAITAGTAAGIARLAKKVEGFLGLPVDIEWATVGTEIYLLQARPITALADEAADESPDPIEAVDVPPGFWQLDISHVPRPHSPMSRSLVLPLINDGLSRTFREFGLLAERLEIRAIGGWHYNRLVPLGGKDRPPPPPWLFWLLVRIHPALRARTRTAVEAVRTGKAMALVRQWQHEWRPQLESDISRLRTRDLSKLSEPDLEAHLEDTRSLLAHGCEIHYVLHGAHVVSLGGLVFACRDLLGWDDQASLGLLSGLSPMSSAPGQRLDELARLVLRNPRLHGILAEPLNLPDIDDIAVIDPEFADAIGEYASQYGGRILGYDVAEPPLASDPAAVLGLLRARLADVDSPQATSEVETRERAVASARTILAQRSPAEQSRFEEVLRKAEETYPTREDNVFFTLSTPLALAHYALCELGDRLVARGQLRQRFDVFLLELPEALSALHDAESRHTLITRRHREQAFAATHPGPASYGRDPGPPPPTWVLPAEAHFLHEAFEWYTGSVFAFGQSPQGTSENALLHGVGASPGIYTGPVRKISTEKELDSIQPGEVLVAPTTSPAFSVVFSRIGALITDSGGILSHPAIIAREYGVPAVVATGSATASLRTGQTVTVDGGAGTVMAGGATAGIAKASAPQH